MSLSKNLPRWNRDLIRLADDMGWRLERRRKHLCLISPRGRKLFTSATPSDNRRIFKNVRAEMRRVAREEANA